MAEDKDEKPSFKKLSGDHLNRKKSSTGSNHSSKSNGSTEEWVTKSSLKNSIENDSSTSTNSSTSTSSGSSYAPSTRSSRKSSGSTKYKPSEKKSRKKVDIKALLKPKVIDEAPKLTLEERELILVENADDVQGNLMAQSLYVWNGKNNREFKKLGWNLSLTLFSSLAQIHKGRHGDQANSYCEMITLDVFHCCKTSTRISCPLINFYSRRSPIHYSVLSWLLRVWGVNWNLGFSQLLVATFNVISKLKKHAYDRSNLQILHLVAHPLISAVQCKKFYIPYLYHVIHTASQPRINTVRAPL